MKAALRIEYNTIFKDDDLTLDQRVAKINKIDPKVPLGALVIASEMYKIKSEFCGGNQEFLIFISAETGYKKKKSICFYD